MRDFTLSKRQRQALVLLADHGGWMSHMDLKRAAERRWGQGAWKFGKAIAELVKQQWVRCAAETFRLAPIGYRAIGREPDGDDDG